MRLGERCHQHGQSRGLLIDFFNSSKIRLAQQMQTTEGVSHCSVAMVADFGAVVINRNPAMEASDAEILIREKNRARNKHLSAWSRPPDLVLPARRFPGRKAITLVVARPNGASAIWSVWC
jgi:hypothetical protein